MALIKCPECGKDISDKAAACPNCGAPVEINQKQNAYQNSYETFSSTQQQQKASKMRENGGANYHAVYSNGVEVKPYKKKKKSKKGIIVAVIIAFVLLLLIIPTNDNDREEQKTVDQSVEESAKTEEKEPESTTIGKAKAEVAEKPEETKKEEAKISKEDFIASCEEIPYKTLARNPENNIGKHIKLTVKVTQIVQGGLFDNGEYYRVYTNDEYNMWLEDEYFMYDCRDEKDVKILQDDILTVYAEFDGTTTVTRALTNTKEEVPSIKAIYIDLIEDGGYSEYTTSDESNESEDDGLSTSQRNALKQAESYLEWSAFSYNGLVEQLEYEKYSHEDAAFAADHCGADWNEQAVKKAKSYLEFSSFSKDGLIEQLEYEGFTHKQAVYGAEQNGY